MVVEAVVPLTDLVEYFNQRISAEQGLETPPLSYRHGKVEGYFGGLRLASEFHSIRRANEVSVIFGQDAGLQAFRADESQTSLTRVFHSADAGAIINVDRLCRTIHMLNYLPVAHEEGYLFLHVHPRHILGLKRDHGAYFEEVIFRCGLSPRRVVVTVPVTPVYDRQLSLLLEGLKNYQSRGYGTAIKFDDQASDAFMERYCIEFLYRMTPDFVRVDASFFSNIRANAAADRRKSSLVSVIGGLDAQFLVEGIDDAKDYALSQLLRADLLAGRYFDDSNASDLGRKAQA